MLLNALVYDGKIERTISTDGSNMYRAIQPLLSSPGLIKVPCGICPVRRIFIIIETMYIYDKFHYIYYRSD